ncbi:MAG TPA: M15 family metallopeptidase [Polyangiaceae bacterium]|nr:M15 family metallopeptidase [Polyangiaceae bacterium]
MRAAGLVCLASMALLACGAAGGTRTSPPAVAAPAVAIEAPLDASTREPEVDVSTPQAAGTAPDAGPSEPPPSPEPEAPSSACNEQSPQEFLVRGNFLRTPDGNLRAIQYRTDQYGYYKGFGHPGPDAQPPTVFVVSTTFMGLPVRMHRKIVPALACVEQEIRRTCADHPYTAHALAGIRTRNTYRGGEVTNHAYGIAIDVDPDRNTCCGCVKPWNDAPICKRPAKTEYDRMAMPECWVHAFERFGFYWLGHDALRDTMHFEFLGDPDRITRTPATTGAREPER